MQRGLSPGALNAGGGSRAQQVQGELGELLNIVRYFDDPQLFVAAALLPAQVRARDVELVAAEGDGPGQSEAANVYCQGDTIRRAIGKQVRPHRSAWLGPFQP